MKFKIIEMESPQIQAPFIAGGYRITLEYCMDKRYYTQKDLDEIETRLNELLGKKCELNMIYDKLDD